MFRYKRVSPRGDGVKLTLMANWLFDEALVKTDPGAERAENNAPCFVVTFQHRNATPLSGWNIAVRRGSHMRQRCAKPATVTPMP